ASCKQRLHVVANRPRTSARTSIDSPVLVTSPRTSKSARARTSPGSSFKDSGGSENSNGRAAPCRSRIDEMEICTRCHLDQLYGLDERVSMTGACHGGPRRGDKTYSFGAVSYV